MSLKQGYKPSGSPHNIDPLLINMTLLESSFSHFVLAPTGSAWVQQFPHKELLNKQGMRGEKESEFKRSRFSSSVE